jgi:septal ring factor EnvC (AmiA/AmiB activator)
MSSCNKTTLIHQQYSQGGLGDMILEESIATLRQEMHALRHQLGQTEIENALLEQKVEQLMVQLSESEERESNLKK